MTVLRKTSTIVNNRCSYYIDDDTGLYYCNARYYSPKWHRFISPDDTAYLAPESVNGLNLYCYCGNDPVNYCDPSGRSVIVTLLAAALVSGFVSAGANVLGQVVFEGKSLDKLDWRKVAIAGASGFCAGLIPGAGIATAIGQAVVSSLVENALGAIWLGDEFNVDAIIKDAVLSILTGLAVDGISQYTAKLSSAIFHKAPNYSQYQHYFRKKGLNYSRREVYDRMRRHMSCKRIIDQIAEPSVDFIISFSTYLL